MVKGFCVKCREKKEIENLKIWFGFCPECKTKIIRDDFIFDKDGKMISYSKPLSKIAKSNGINPKYKRTNTTG